MRSDVNVELVMPTAEFKSLCAKILSFAMDTKERRISFRKVVCRESRVHAPEMTNTSIGEHFGAFPLEDALRY